MHKNQSKLISEIIHTEGYTKINPTQLYSPEFNGKVRIFVYIGLKISTL